MATNKKLGNDFETEFCNLLYEQGFWVHNMAQNQAGQPADVIAVRNGKAFLIDCKVCSNMRFPLSRVEENQHYAMELWKECGNGEGWFALKLNDTVYMIPHFTMRAYLNSQQASISAAEIWECGKPFEEWVRKCK